MKPSTLLAIFLPIFAAIIGVILAISSSRRESESSPRIKTTGWILLILGLIAFILLVISHL
jgi:uncharacterized membrane protein